MKIHHFILKGFEHLKKERLFKINFEVKTVNFRCCLNENRTMGATRVSVFPPKFFSHGNGKNWELGNFSLGIPGNFSKS